jgi:glycosyltransferase involved in cell wall biosynthesis
MSLRIAIVKPDYRVVGGYELVLTQIAEGLRTRGHAVEMVYLDASESPGSRLPFAIPEAIIRQFPEFFSYASLAMRFEDLDLSAFDAVISNMPPSFAVRHPRHVALFYHHFKFCYDLLPAAIEAGLYEEPILRFAAEIVREIDQPYFSKQLTILAGSHHIKQRLAQFNGLEENVQVCHVGMDADFYHYAGPTHFREPVCIGRHEFPKRPELFIHAMKHLPEMTGKLVGVGGKTEALKRIDTYLSHQHVVALEEVDDRKLWQEIIFNTDRMDSRKFEQDLAGRGYRSNVEFTGRVSKERLIREYADALCVVCPAYEEDYGLTAIEAMAFGKPVIACEDGGGYLELITHGVDGFIVPPTGEAIAEAIRQLSDPRVAEAMGRKAYEKSRSFTWERAIDQVEAALLAPAV